MLVIIAIFLQHSFRENIGNRIFVFFYPIIFIGALFGRLWSSVAATILATFAIWYLFLKPYYSFQFKQNEDLFGLVVFMATGFLSAYLSQKVISLARAFEKQATTFDIALSSSPDFHYILDVNQRFTYVNKSLLKLWGLNLEQAVGKNFKDLGYSEELVKLHKSQLNEVMTGKTVKGESSYTNSEGTTGHYEYIFTPVFDSTGKVQAISGTTRDVTDQKNNEENRLNQQRMDLILKQSLESEHQFRNLADSMPQLAWMAKADGYIFWYNQGWYKYTGTRPEQMEGWGWQIVHDPEVLPIVMEKWPLAIENEKPFKMEFPLRGKDGTFRWFLTRATPIKDGEGKVVRWFGTNTDINDHKTLREKLKHAVSMRDEFISIASHEFKTPITSLKMHIQLLQRQFSHIEGKNPFQDKLENSLSVQLKQIDRLTNLVEEMLDVSRIQTGKIEYTLKEVELTSMVENLVEEFSDEFKAAGCRVQVLTSGPVSVLADHFRLEQVMVNLITNSIKYASGKPVDIEVSTNNKTAEILVKDYGMGIPKEKLTTIFERFERATSHDHISGLGLGLYIAKEIVTAHKGTLTVESELQRGTTFSVKLPIANKS